MTWTSHLRPALAGLDIYDSPQVAARARLHANECPEPWPAEVMAELGRRVESVELGRYPDASGRSLRHLLARQHGCDPDAIVLGNGSDEVISLLLTALAGRTSEPSFMVIPSPTFVMYGHSARCLGVGVLEVPLTEQLELDEAVMNEALGVANGAAICFLARPNNPTSSLWDAAVIERLIAGNPGTMFVLDEAYIRYSPGASLWRQDLPGNVTYMSTLSKVGLAALRVGYCIAPPALARAANVVRHPYNISATSLLLAESVLRDFPEVQAGLIARSIANRDRLVALLASIPGAHVFPAHANIALVRLDPPQYASRLADALAARGVLVKDASSLPRLSGCLRVGVGTSAELDILAAALAELVPNLGPDPSQAT
ncbi:histidinol-phosphate transaminase [Nannocystis sp.]|uniref:pyridoxal phosphate-dependent aminotransferase n=1 Tax=Nannocystis sp. TaxID=1962667 RepID=UPI0025E39C91|nr:histidinol-phosphate transaminase [Nannocystis sp.]MBK7828048.1 aminotransferase class I/II-fold pyridoxal phosphate-dependent enzyme [Nannocystis sp.]